MGWSHKIAKAQIGIYSSADTALLAADLYAGDATGLYGAGCKPKTPKIADGQVVDDGDDAA